MARLAAFAAVLCLLPVVSAAQDRLASAPLQMGLPSASLDRTRAPFVPPSGQPDLFLATPTTYEPGFSEPPRINPGLPCCGGFAGPVYTTVGPWWPAPPQVVYVPVIVRETPRPVPAAPPAAAAPAGPPAAPAPPRAPGPPKTFYVIPRCYAGDRPPERDALPPGCDIGRLRTLPPVR